MTVAALQKVPLLADAVQSNKLQIAGAFYALDTGKVEVLVPR